ncbi:tRNA (adenosine(37)-N6)-dimethylallyltransferase MiaA [candidate division FCPU426 bacterium]|nr:tRNA (adenosine(37)-N6)-dimethylallyltransferase MiaA [candidate division FCPU426 bacterium]
MPQTTLIVLAGPTAAGKTALAVALASRMRGEIISADSRQIYRGLDIGTGKPSLAECQKVKHHLLSVAEPAQVVTAEDFALLADQALADITAAGKNAWLVGGTGLWMRAFVDGLAPLPAADPVLRKQLQQRAQKEGNESLHRQLAEADPETAKKLHVSDRLRIIRALEILMLTGEKPSARRRQRPLRAPLPAVWFGITRPRTELYQRAEERIAHWLKEGWLEKVSQVLQTGVQVDAPAMQAIGYSHLARHLQGEYSLERAVDLLKRDTRRYIKRQITWFRAEQRITWVNPSLSVAEIRAGMEEKIRAQGR